MSKAEDRAEKAFPLMSNDDKEGLEALKYIGMECECASVFNEAQEAKQAYFIEGYHQAEKDLELTWEDMMLIHKCIKDAMNYHLYKMMEGVEGQKVVYQEVLKRFKDLKN